MKKARLVAYVIGTTFAAAQPSAVQAQPAEQHATAETNTRDPETIDEQLDELTEGIAQQAADIKNLQNRAEQHKKLTEERAAEKEETEFAQYQEMSQLMIEIEEASIRRINIYGFFDFTFYKYFFDDHSGFHLLMPSNSSLAVTGLNLYFQSELVDDVKFLTEVRFSYQPDGYEADFEIENVPGTEYVQTDAMVRAPYTTEHFDQGGITIIRANLTYQPLDYFYIKAGRYITPFGIWNVDHGSPVVLPARLPYMQIRRVVPPAQTGLMVGGRAFPTDSMFLHYALTVSNGRGQIDAPLGFSDALFDTDENKALGLRLKGTWQHREAQISLGTYGYVGSGRSIKKVVVIAGSMTDPEGKVPEDQPGIVEVKDTCKHHEYIVTADFQLDWLGLRLQAEYVWLYNDFSIPMPRLPYHVLAKGGTPYVDQWHEPSYTGYDIYGLIAYTLPLQSLIGAFRITPYYLYERSARMDTAKFETMYMHIAGLNMAPWPELVLKLEWSWIIPEVEEVFGSRLMGLVAQMAVSF